jgi:hypothetical protein
MGSMLAVSLLLSVVLTGCASAQTAGEGSTGCQVIFGTVDAVNKPENSKLSCEAINKLTSAIPSKPETYLTKEPHSVLWKCKFYGLEARRLLLRCAHHNRHFSVLKV